MAWRLAKSLDTLRAQVNALYPNRSKTSDGTVGDAAHASRSSDHNPWVLDGKTGVVTALDLTHDPARGIDGEKLAARLVEGRDSRIKYIIWNRKIISGAAGPKPWQPRPYKGKNPHDHHVHISVNSQKAHYDRLTRWELDLTPDTDPIGRASVTHAQPTLLLKSTGEAVRHLQELLKIEVDGLFGQKTEKAVKAFQKSKKLVADGIVGFYTWKALI